MQHFYSFSAILLKTSNAEVIQKAIYVDKSQHVCVVVGGGCKIGRPEEFPEEKQVSLQAMFLSV